jgi:hypothetical protein
MARGTDASEFLARLAAALKTARVRITWKADDEIASVGWSRQDALDQLRLLEAAELLRTEPSMSAEFTTLWVFCPLAWDLDRYLWIRLTENENRTFLVSFHLAEGNPWS